jgi:hypothetical protein
LIRPVVLHLLWDGQLQAGPDLPAVGGYPGAATRSGGRMSGQSLTLCPRTRLLYDGDVVEVAKLARTRVLLRNSRTAQFITVQVSLLVARARQSASGLPGRTGGRLR